MSNDIDFQLAATLMDVMSKQVTVAPMMTAIFGEASEELKEINRQCEENRDERAKEIRANEQVAEQQRLSAAEEANATDSIADPDGRLVKSPVPKAIPASAVTTPTVERKL